MTTRRRTAGLALFCLALIALAGAETMWSLALSSAQTECRGPVPSAGVAACRCSGGAAETGTR